MSNREDLKPSTQAVGKQVVERMEKIANEQTEEGGAGQSEGSNLERKFDEKQAAEVITVIDIGEEDFEKTAVDSKRLLHL